MTYTCERCGDTETETIDATGHTVAIDAAVAPTCTKTGLTEGKHCSVCKKVLVEQEVLQTIPHNYVNGICTMCGKRDESYATKGLVFTLSDDGTYYRVTKYVGTAMVVYIPSIYQGLPVVSIGDAAFKDYNYKITSVKIANGVIAIGTHAFSGCSYLEWVTIPDSVTLIGDSAFAKCTLLTNVTIPNSVTSIGDSAFYNCDLTSITIPDSVTSIGDSAFQGCENLVRITVSTENPVYHSAKNCLIETGSKTLVVGCKNSIIPDDGSVTSIGDNAFSRCTRLTNITIPDSVTSIGDSAFAG